MKKKGAPLRLTHEKLILKMSVSVDGFVAGPKGELDWLFATESKDAEIGEVD